MNEMIYILQLKWQLLQKQAIMIKKNQAYECRLLDQ